MENDKILNEYSELNSYLFNQNMACQLRNKIDVMFGRFKSLILILFITATAAACVPMGATVDEVEAEAEAEASLTGDADPMVIDLDGDIIELDESYAVEVGDIDFGGSATQSDEDASETDFENPDTSTVGMLPTIAKEGEECSTEGSAELAVRSLDTGDAETTAYLAAAPSSYARSRRFFTSTDFITSLRVTDDKQFESLKDDEAEVGVDGLVCTVDDGGKLTWQPLELHEIKDNYRLAFGFVDEDNHFLDKNLLLENIGADGSVFIPKEYLAVQEGEQVYVALVHKKTRVMQNAGAVVISNTGSKITMTFPPSLTSHFGSK